MMIGLKDYVRCDLRLEHQMKQLQTFQDNKITHEVSLLHNLIQEAALINTVRMTGIVMTILHTST